ncbi:MAG: CotH kinase family protein [Phycisphaerae bacterium]|nr:CotH kinase family protein [Phycisphaerae bacterium]
MKIYIDNGVNPEKKIFRKRKGLLYKLTIAFVLVCVLLLMFVLGVYFALQTHSSGSAKTLIGRLGQLRQTKLGIVSNYIDGLKARPETITIDIKHENFMKLQYHRDLALQRRLLINTDDSYVAAAIRYDGKTYKTDIRLKGDMIDHLGSNKWSFRIKVKGDNTIMDMKQFSLHTPAGRNYIHEWLLHQELRREGLISLRYKFVNVTVNGQDWGVYAVEEHFEKRLIEANQKRQGPILKFNEDILWQDKAQFHPLYVVNNPDMLGMQSIYASCVEPFKITATLADDNQYQLFLAAKDKLQAFTENKLQLNQVVDTEAMAKFMAITMVFGAEHGNFWNNIRFYYNPVTALLEPVGYDGQGGLISDMYMLTKDTETILLRLMLNDNDFYTLYLQALSRIGNKDYLDDFFAEVDDELKSNLHIIYRSYPDFYFSKANYYANCQTVHKTLNPSGTILANLICSDVNKVEVDIANIHCVPVQLLGLVNAKGQLVATINSDVIIEPKGLKIAAKHYPVSFDLTDPIEISSKQQYMPLFVKYQIAGSDAPQQANIVSWPYLQQDQLAIESQLHSPNPDHFEFLTVNEETKTIDFAIDNCIVTSPLILPAGYTIRVFADTKIDIQKGGFILSYSPVYMTGNEDQPIEIYSSDKQGGGLTLIKAGSRSRLHYVKFSGLSNPSLARWNMSGSVNFYESPVDIYNCEFADNSCEDCLNIIRSDFSLKDSLLHDTSSDAFDGDFVTGFIQNTTFNNCGNDAVDVSGSNLEIEGLRIINVGDKGLSAGEHSHIVATDVKIEKAEIALASKDNSTLEIKDSTVNNCKVVMASYQKKPEFGPANIIASNLTCNNIKELYLLEAESSISMNQKQLQVNCDKVELILYGAEYGKASKPDKPEK